MSKFEKRFGRYAISNLTAILIMCYVAGYILQFVNDDLLLLLTLDPYRILQGQIWRLVTWIIVPPSSLDIFTLLMLYFYYSVGNTLERAWGTYRYNVYIFSGMFFTILASFASLLLVYVMHGELLATKEVAQSIFLSGSTLFSTYYVNMSLYLAFALMYPNLQVLIYFIIPVKVKWMAILYVVLMGYDIFRMGQLYSAYYGAGIGILVSVIMFVVNAMSLLNFIVFFFSSRDMRRYSPKEVKRKQEFRRQMAEPRPGSGITRHKCAVCGRTEVSNPELEFRYCSKCEGNFEYCQDHLFTHQHVHRE